jgi:hypothetical protein
MNTSQREQNTSDAWRPPQRSQPRSRRQNGQSQRRRPWCGFFGGPQCTTGPGRQPLAAVMFALHCLQIAAAVWGSSSRASILVQNIKQDCLCKTLISLVTRALLAG